MTLETLIDALPDYAKDLKLNFSTLVRQPAELTPTQLWGTVVAAAVAGKNSALLHAVVKEAEQNVDAQVVNAAKAAATIMAMNNVFYRFQHLAGHEKYRTMPARLRMNVMRTHGVNALDFELWSAAVSAINGCGTCMEAHDRKLRESGVSEETVIMAVRVASVVNAISTVLEADMEPAAVAV